jgi:hypothetical protein
MRRPGSARDHEGADGNQGPQGREPNGATSHQEGGHHSCAKAHSNPLACRRSGADQCAPIDCECCFLLMKALAPTHGHQWPIHRALCAFQCEQPPPQRQESSGTACTATALVHSLLTPETCSSFWVNSRHPGHKNTAGSCQQLVCNFASLQQNRDDGQAVTEDVQPVISAWRSINAKARASSQEIRGQFNLNHDFFWGGIAVNRVKVS